MSALEITRAEQVRFKQWECVREVAPGRGRQKSALWKLHC